MTKNVLNLETVTPMLLRGNNNKTPELRPPSFKALFRYWWRTVQDCDTDSLRKEEAKWFGSTDGKSPFSLRIPGTTELNIAKYQLLPHKSGNQGNPIDAYRINQQFNLYFLTKNGQNIDYYKQTAKLGFLLGGVGSRSRRGFGSIRETCWDFKDICDLRVQVLRTLNDVAKTDRFQIKSSLSINGRNFDIIEANRRANYPPKYPVVQRIFFGELTEDFKKLLKKIGQATSDAKQRNKDYTLGDGRPRMASPIIVRIQKINSQYLPVVTQLYSKYPTYVPKEISKKQNSFIYDIIT